MKIRSLPCQKLLPLVLWLVTLTKETVRQVSVFCSCCLGRCLREYQCLSTSEESTIDTGGVGGEPSRVLEGMRLNDCGVHCVLTASLS